jgi:hypothetical protein
MAWLVDDRGRVLASVVGASAWWFLGSGSEEALDLGAGPVLWPGIGGMRDAVVIVVSSDWQVVQVRELRLFKPWIVAPGQHSFLLPRHVVAHRSPSVGDRIELRG